MQTDEEILSKVINYTELWAIENYLSMLVVYCIASHYADLEILVNF
jgi:hypothetical protein